MRRLVLLTLFSVQLMNSGISWAQNECETDDFYQNSDIGKILASPMLLKSSQHYLFFQTKNLEDLQVLKNCIDYLGCGKGSESIVDDPKNPRIHIWKQMNSLELASLVSSCPIKDIKTRLIVKDKDAAGRRISLDNMDPSASAQKALLSKAEPAFYQGRGPALIKATIKKIQQFLNSAKTKEAELLAFKTWNIKLDDYKIQFGGVEDNVATTNHAKKIIQYGKEWLKDSCSFVRMLRHEAEHVAQTRMARQCGKNHNFESHEMRERAAHLNDVRFVKSFCPEATDIQEVCMNRFKKMYMKTKKPGKK